MFCQCSWHKTPVTLKTMQYTGISFKVNIILPKMEDLYCRNEFTDHGMGSRWYSSYNRFFNFTYLICIQIYRHTFYKICEVCLKSKSNRADLVLLGFLSPCKHFFIWIVALYRKRVFIIEGRVWCFCWYMTRKFN